ncbi:MAG: hypothetical protein ACREB6_14130 [Rhodospirillales bacterium]
MTRYLALAVVSAATLAYEVLLVRLFAIVQWYHFAFMAISIALLGFGLSGTLLALLQDRVRARFTATFALGAVLFAFTAPAGFLVAQALPFNALAVVWEPGQLLYLPAMYLLLAVPFFCGAACIGVAFVCFGDRIGRIYACNLIGSGVGALGVVAALFVLTPSDTMRLIAAFGLVAAALVVLDGRPIWRPALAVGAAAAGIAALALLPDAWLALRVSEYKGLPGALRVAGAKVLSERSGPLGLLTVVESPDVPFRYVPGLSLNAPMAPPPQLGVFIDGGSLTAITRFDGRPDRLAYLDYTTDALAYHLAPRPSVLVLGAGGGQGVLQALYHRARRIDAVELDPNMVRLVSEDYAAYAGHIWSRPEVRVHVADARGFVAASRRQWDLVQIPLLDAFAAGAAGVHGLSESYLYTREAFEHYLRCLAPGGWLSITRWLKLPPRDALKLFTTALDALRQLGVEAPEKRLVLLRGLTTATLLVKNGAVTGADIAAARAFAAKRSFDLDYYPGIQPQEANRFNVLDRPYYFAGAQALIGAGRDAFIAGYKFDIRPATDERPYFFDFLKWRSLPELLAIRKAGGAGLLELGSLILAATLVQATVLSVVLIMAPIGMWRWWGRRAERPATVGRKPIHTESSPPDQVGGRPSRKRGARLFRSDWIPAFAGMTTKTNVGETPDHLWRVGLYFLALGLAFLFIEIAFIQKFILFLGHPLYAVAVVLTGFLLFAGIGSAAAARMEARVEAWRSARPGRALRLSAIEVAVAGIAALAVLYVVLLPGVFEALSHLADDAKVAVSLALIAPLAFFMGMPFPLGLTRVQAAAPALVPWAWGVNGCASVLSALLATLIAMNFGFSAVVVLGALLYLGAAAAFIRPPAAWTG